MRRLTPRSPRGFTLPEILVALMLFGIVGTVLTRILVSSQRTTTAQQARAAMQSNLRVASFVVPNELRMLNQSDSTDILDVSDTSITYRAMRGYYVLCEDITDPSEIKVTRVENSPFGFDYRLPAKGDSAFIFFENDTLKISDDRWVRVGLSEVEDALCADFPEEKTVGLTLRFTGKIDETPFPLAGFVRGAAVRTYEVTRLSLYEADGEQWLGMCTGDEDCTLEPVVGPLADAGGFLLTRYDDDGAVEDGNTFAERNSLRSLRIRFVGKTAQGITRGPGGDERSVLTDTLSTIVTLRNVKQN